MNKEELLQEEIADLEDTVNAYKSENKRLMDVISAKQTWIEGLDKKIDKLLFERQSCVCKINKK